MKHTKNLLIAVMLVSTTQLFGAAHSSTVKKLMSPTESYLTTTDYVPEVAKEFGAYISKNQAFVEQIIANELQIAANGQRVLYHASNGLISFLQDLMYLLEQTRGIKPRPNWLPLRPLDTVVPFKSAQEFVRLGHTPMTFSQRSILFTDDRTKHFADALLATNLSLFGNVRMETSSTFDYYIKNRSAFISDLDEVTNLLEQFLIDYNIDTIHVNSLVAIAQKYASTQGTLLQIVLDDDLINRFTYLCIPGGHPLKAPLFYTDGIPVAPTDFDRALPGYNKITNVLNAYQTNAGAIINVDALQARLLLTQEALEKITVYRYRTMPNEKEYYKELVTVVEQVINKESSTTSITLVAPTTLYSIDPSYIAQAKKIVNNLALEITINQTIENNDLKTLDTLIPSLNQAVKNRFLVNTASKNQWNATQLFLKHGADQKTYDGEGYQIIHYAALNGRCDLIEEFVKQGADINAVSKISNSSILHIAVSTCDAQSIQRLIKLGANYNAKNQKNNSVLMVSMILPSGEKRWSIPRILLKLGAKLEPHEHSSISLPAAYGAWDIVDHLLEQGININLQNWLDKTTLLHMAVQQNNTEQVALLLERGADINIRNDSGKTPFDIALQNNNPEIIQMFRVRGAKPSPGTLPKAKL